MIIDKLRQVLHTRNKELGTDLRFTISDTERKLHAKDSWLDKIEVPLYVRDDRSGYLGLFLKVQVTEPKDASSLTNLLYEIAALEADARQVAEQEQTAPWSIHLFAVCVLDGVSREEWSETLAVELSTLQSETNVLAAVGLTTLMGTADDLAQRLEVYEAAPKKEPEVHQFLAPLLLFLRRSEPDPLTASTVTESFKNQFLVGVEQLWSGVPLPGAKEVAAEGLDELRRLSDFQVETPAEPVREISQLSLQKFRRFEKESVDLHHWTVIVGGNGSGKTSLVEALEVGLTGRSDRVESGNGTPDILTHVGETALGWGGELTLTEGKPIPVGWRDGISAKQAIRAFYLTQEDLSAFARADDEDREWRMLSLWGLDRPVKHVIEELEHRSREDLKSFPNLEPSPDTDAAGGYLAGFRNRLDGLWSQAGSRLAGDLSRAFLAVKAAGLNHLFVPQMWEQWMDWHQSWQELRESWNDARNLMNTGPVPRQQRFTQAVDAFVDAIRLLLDAYEQLQGTGGPGVPGSSAARKQVDPVDLVIDLLVGDFLDGQPTERQAYRRKVEAAGSDTQPLRKLAEAWMAFRSGRKTDLLSDLSAEAEWYSRSYRKLLRLNWLRAVQESFARWRSDTLAGLLAEQKAGEIFLELVGALTTLNWTHLPIVVEQTKVQVGKPMSPAPFRASLSAMLNQAEQQIVGLAWFFTAYHFRGCRFTSTLMLDDPFQGFDEANLHSFVRMFNDIVRLLGPRSKELRGPQVVLATHDYRIAQILREEYADPEGGANARTMHYPQHKDRERITVLDVVRGGNYSSKVKDYPAWRKQQAKWERVFVEV